ncbi:hypothetical protein [Amycolatopsis thermoflava]|uniref:hypothetical protein n=1 Tax=Amycolatopsis thermoflava TaxID=84480 RepID=UPI0037F75B63
MEVVGGRPIDEEGSPVDDRALLLSIEGSLDQIDPKALSTAVEALTALLQHLSLSPGAWSLAELRAGSIEVGLRGPRDEADLVEGGLAAFARRPAIPDGWNLEAVKALTKLEGVRKLRGVEGLSMRIGEQIQRVDDALLANAKESIKPGPPSLGSVTGVLFRYNHLEKTAGIRDTFRDEQIAVKFGSALARELRANLTNVVRIRGEVLRDVLGRRVSIDAESIELIEEAPEPQRPASELAGLFIPDARTGVDSVTWQRRQRNG